MIGVIAVYLPAHRSFTYALATLLGVSIELGSSRQLHFKASKNIPKASSALSIISSFSSSLKGNPSATPLAKPALTTSSSSFIRDFL